jgi:hypothetical protein
VNPQLIDPERHSADEGPGTNTTVPECVPQPFLSRNSEAAQESRQQAAFAAIPALTSYVPALREREVLLQLASFRYLSQAQIDELLLAGSAATRPSREVIVKRVLRRLRARGFVSATARLVGGPGAGSARVAYFLTTVGYRYAQTLNPSLPARRMTLRGTFFMAHGMTTAEVLLALRRAAATSCGHEIVSWECDWAVAFRVGTNTIVPDAYLLYRTPRVELAAFIEVDLGTEGTRRFARKMSRYVSLYRSGLWRDRLGVWPVVLTITTSTIRATALRRATEPLLSSQSDGTRLVQATEFDFCALTDFLGQPGPLGCIWQVAGRDGLHEVLDVAVSDGP